jgi:integrase
MARWITPAPGIRYRKHASRKHGAQLDRYFTLRFSIDGKQVEEALGWASQGWTVKRAQEELSRLHKAKRTGQGPATLRDEADANRRAAQAKAEAEAAEARRQKLVRDLWGRYAAEVISIANKPRTAAEKSRMWMRRINPAIGHLRINDITGGDVGAIVRSPLRLDASGQVVGGKAEAGNLYRLLNHVFHKALGWGLRAKEAGNPLENVSEPKTARRERLLTGGEIGALIRALDAAGTDATEYPQVVAAIRAAILTGARISELLSLQWSNIRRDEMELHLTDTKSGFSRRPISADALAVLDSVERMPGTGYVFRAINTPTAPLSYNTVEKAFRRITERAGVDCTLHVIRHWAITAIANSVGNVRVGMRVSGHKSTQAYLGYVHSDREQARALAEQLGQLATGLAKAPSNVAEIAKAGAAE